MRGFFVGLRRPSADQPGGEAWKRRPRASLKIGLERRRTRGALLGKGRAPPLLLKKYSRASSRGKTRVFQARYAGSIPAARTNPGRGVTVAHELPKFEEPVQLRSPGPILGRGQETSRASKAQQRGALPRRPAINISRRGRSSGGAVLSRRRKRVRLPSAGPLGCSVMATQQTLDLLFQVQVLAPQPILGRSGVHSSAPG